MSDDLESRLKALELADDVPELAPDSTFDVPHVLEDDEEASAPEPSPTPEAPDATTPDDRYEFDEGITAFDDVLGKWSPYPQLREKLCALVADQREIPLFTVVDSASTEFLLNAAAAYLAAMPFATVKFVCARTRWGTLAEQVRMLLFERYLDGYTRHLLCDGDYVGYTLGDTTRLVRTERRDQEDHHGYSHRFADEMVRIFFCSDATAINTHVHLTLIDADSTRYCDPRQLAAVAAGSTKECASDRVVCARSPVVVHVEEF